MANEKRLIDADALFNDLADYWGIPRDWDGRMLQTCEDALSAIENAPTVDAVEVVHGQWLYDSGSERYFCSACKEYALSATTNEQVADYDWEENLVYHIEVVTKEFWTDYCPNCGAKMDGDGNE